MNTLPVIYTERFLEHDTGPWHPERPERLVAVVEHLRAAPFSSRLIWREPRAASPEQLGWIHDASLIKTVEAASKKGGGALDPDTIVSPLSFDVALLAAGGWLDGVDAVLSNNEPAWVLARPPGHHAERDRAMGFCLFSNAALAAHYALRVHHLERVAVLDWDVHHGNGTQQLCWSEPRLAYVSLHQSPQYPGTGHTGETGGSGNVLNVPLPAGSDRSTYQRAFTKQIWPFLERFEAQLLIVSAGFDAHSADPLAEMCLQASDYGEFARQCLNYTRRVLFGLEGGYDLDALAASVLAVTEACLQPI
ncbi:histone deacetylase [Gloeobacter kilaueensis]|uniref:Histone deacetylase superfamily protein n=1 Tax=Gloeobacter kilaueensis (strain ATCC BAA-2537 / CCAP 1431/1 / ULC 316 / JS1) TaxID=1183438 RepID=U5QRW7_GLOK1|nr:histone deacetylase [Gloeobacter kilaueensis]AGY60359.1 histone deacetylase superfamily protein [Gloeobacter kilaueensis JS1]